MAGLRPIGKWLLRCELALLYTAVASTAAMMLLTTADAACRYFLDNPILGAYELTEKYLMVTAIFLGLPYAYRGGAFIRMTLLADRLSGKVKLAADGFAHLVTLAFCLVFAFATAGQSLRALADATTLSTLPVPVGPAYCLVPLGFLALTVLMLADLRRFRSGRSLLLARDAPTA